MWWAYNSYAAKASPRSPLVPSPASGVRAKARPEGIWAYDVPGRPPSVPAARLSRLPYSYAVAVLRLGTGSPVAPRSRRASAISGGSPNRGRPHTTATMSATVRPIRARSYARDARPTYTRSSALLPLRLALDLVGEVVRQGRAAHVHEVERQPQRQQALDIGTLRIGAPDHRFPVGVVVQR